MFWGADEEEDDWGDGYGEDDVLYCLFGSSYQLCTCGRALVTCVGGFSRAVMRLLQNPMQRKFDLCVPYRKDCKRNHSAARCNLVFYT